MSKPEEIVYQFMGTDGEYLATVPARDLTAEDVGLLSPFGLRDLANSPLYKPKTTELPDKEAPKGGKDN